MAIPTHGLHILPLAAALSAVALIGAEPRTDWNALGALTPQERIKVYRHAEKTLSGRFAGYSATVLTLETKTGKRNIQREDIWRVSRRTRRKTLLGALIGAGVGVGVMVSWIIRDEYENDIIYPLVFTPIGAAIGAMFRGQKDVYRIPRKPK